MQACSRRVRLLAHLGYKTCRLVISLVSYFFPSTSPSTSQNPNPPTMASRGRGGGGGQGSGGGRGGEGRGRGIGGRVGGGGGYPQPYGRGDEPGGRGGGLGRGRGIGGRGDGGGREPGGRGGVGYQQPPPPIGNVEGGGRGRGAGVAVPARPAAPRPLAPVAAPAFPAAASSSAPAQALRAPAGAAGPGAALAAGMGRLAVADDPAPPAPAAGRSEAAQGPSHQPPPLSSKGISPPSRPGFGTLGRKLLVSANHFVVQVADNDICHYDVSSTPFIFFLHLLVLLLFAASDCSGSVDIVLIFVRDL